MNTIFEIYWKNTYSVAKNVLNLFFINTNLFFRYIYQEDELQQACDDLQRNGNPQSAWDLLAPGTEDAEEAAHAEGPSNERQMDPEDLQANIDSIVRPTDASEGTSHNAHLD